MSKALLSRLAGFFRTRTMVGVDKAGNRYFTRTEQVDGTMKEKRWVIFKGEDDPTSIPVEWICWLNGQRKRPPTQQEMAQLEEMRQRVKQNVALLKKEEEERKAKEVKVHKETSAEKLRGPDLSSFLKQFPTDLNSGTLGDGTQIEDPRVSNEITNDKTEELQTSEPSGSGASFRPGTWQPPA
uniref:NADH dehydrogenase [ubiquinone] 1 alpha subcomplex subunit 12 n=1 Tax=Kalanchoe fedtschenkoi TaxID=63787 RepID=A0A7N0TPX7_KALFE